MNDQYNNPDLMAASTAADTAAQTANQYQTASAMLPAALKSAINEKLDYNSDLIKQKNISMTDYFNAPSAARLQYQDIFNPFQREALVSKAVNNAYLPYANNQDILTQRLGSIQDIINAATGSFNSQVGSAQGAATLAENKYNRLLGLAGAKQQQSNWLYEMTHAKPSSGGGSGNSILDLLTALGVNINNGGDDFQPDAISSIPTAPPPKPNLDDIANETFGTTDKNAGATYANTPWQGPVNPWNYIPRAK